MTALRETAEVGRRNGLVIRRTWPRSADHVLLDLVSGTGAAVAGQWCAAPRRAAEIAGRTGAPATADGRVVLQPRGVDRRLRALAGLLQQPGAVLISHRAERRAVVRQADGAYVKVVRPERVAELARSSRLVAGAHVRVPEVVGVDARRGVVTSAALPGRTLHALLGDRSPGSAARALAAAHEVGRALAALHAAPLPPGVQVHDAQAELGVLQRWLQLGRAHGVLPASVAPPELASAATRPVLVHRDLHDKQVLVDARGGVGLLDFDLAAAGEPALDLANLLVHLELRAHQGWCTAELAVAAGRAVLRGYEPSPAVVRRLPAYDAATRCRLAAVYGFRPGSSDAIRRLLDTRLLDTRSGAEGAATLDIGTRTAGHAG